MLVVHMRDDLGLGGEQRFGAGQIGKDVYRGFRSTMRPKPATRCAPASAMR